MGVYAVKTDKPIVTTKPLVGRKVSQTYVERMKYMNSHNFSFHISSSNELKVNITEK